MVRWVGPVRIAWWRCPRKNFGSAVSWSSAKRLINFEYHYEKREKWNGYH
jgi:hypothetical protein